MSGRTFYDEAQSLTPEQEEYLLGVYFAYIGGSMTVVRIDHATGTVHMEAARRKGPSIEAVCARFQRRCIRQARAARERRRGW